MQLERRLGTTPDKPKEPPADGGSDRIKSGEDPPVGSESSPRGQIQAMRQCLVLNLLIGLARVGYGSGIDKS